MLSCIHFKFYTMSKNIRLLLLLGRIHQRYQKSSVGYARLILDNTLVFV